MAFIQHIEGWNTGTKIRQTWSANTNYYIFFSKDEEEWVDSEGEILTSEIDIEWMLDNWEVVPVCPHCKGTGLPPKPTKKAKGKKK
jgi:hypothetical protein